MHSGSSKTLSSIALIVALFAIALLIPVLERVTTAVVQQIQFGGDPQLSPIYLSLKTGQIFSCFSAMVLGLAVSVLLLARRRDQAAALVLARLAICLVICGLSIYWMLGFSHLNVWRP